MGLQLWAIRLTMAAVSQANPSHGKTSAHMPTVCETRSSFPVAFSPTFCITLKAKRKFYKRKTHALPLEHCKIEMLSCWGNSCCGIRLTSSDPCIHFLLSGKKQAVQGHNSPVLFLCLLWDKRNHSSAVSTPWKKLWKHTRQLIQPPIYMPNTGWKLLLLFMRSIAVSALDSTIAI